MEREASTPKWWSAFQEDRSSGPSDGTETEERRLILAARADRQAFAPLYRKYVAPVYRYLIQQSGNRQDAEDLTATTFSKALAGLDRYQERGTFAAWLFSIARHTLHDHRRRRRPAVDVELLASALVDPGPQPEAQYLQAEQAQVLRRLVQHLPCDQRDALALYFFGGLRIAEVATVLGRSDGSVRMLVHRAITTLRDQYRREEEP